MTRPRHASQPRLASVLTAAATLVSSVVVVGTGPTPVGAQTETLDASCAVSPATTTGDQSGATAVVAGETVTLSTDIPLEAVEIFQEPVTLADGTVEYPSRITLNLDDTSSLSIDETTYRVTVGDLEQPITTGTDPVVGSWVLDAAGGDAVVYAPLPGTPGESILDVVDPTVLSFAVDATVPVDAPGTVIAASECQASLDFGPQTAVSVPDTSNVALLDSEVLARKSASTTVVSPGAVVTFEIEVEVPELNTTSEVRNADAFDVVVTDTLPAGLTYVNGSSTGVSESGGVLTWTIDTVAAGETALVVYDVRVDDTVATGANLTNAVAVAADTQPGGGVAVAGSADSFTLVNGAEAPSIAKSVDTAVAGDGQTVEYTVSVTWPAGSTWHDVLLTDVAAPNLVDDGSGTGTLACSSTCPTTSTLGPLTLNSGEVSRGFYALQVGPFAADETWTWTYTVELDADVQDFEALRSSDHLNTARIAYNLESKLGGVAPRLDRLPPSDAEVTSAAVVQLDYPVLSVDKSVAADVWDGSDPDTFFTVTVTNHGGTTATDIRLTDRTTWSNGVFYGSVDTASVAGDATWNSGRFVIDSIAPGASATFTYGVSADTLRPDFSATNVVAVQQWADEAGNLYLDNRTETQFALTDSATFEVLVPELTIEKSNIGPDAIGVGAGQTATFEFTVTNVSDAIAYDIIGSDTTGLDASITAATCDAPLALAPDGTITADSLPPGASATCTYDLTLDSTGTPGSYDNTATIDWSAGNDAFLVRTDATVRFRASDQATVRLDTPSLVIDKRPDVDLGGASIADGGTSTFVVAVTNSSALPATGVQIADTLPASLSLAGTPTVTGATGATVTGGPSDTAFTVDIPTIDPLGFATITVPVVHDGTTSVGARLVNTATVVADGVDLLSAEGSLEVVANVPLPMVTKSVSPASGEPGTSATWTVELTVPDAPFTDLTVIDDLPDGFTIDAIVQAGCTGPLCAATTVTDLAPVTLANGDKALGWFLDDVAAAGGPTTFTFEIQTTVADTFDAGGSVGDGTYRNIVRPWFTSTDTHSPTNLPDPTEPSVTLDLRAGSDFAEFDVTIPVLSISKRVAGGTASEPGASVDYSVTVSNSGSATATDIVVVDDGAAGAFQSLVVTPPAGVTVTDDYTTADPDLVMTIDTLDAGQSITIPITAVVTDSPDLVPGLSSDPRDVAVVDNRATIDSFTTPSGATRTSGPSDNARLVLYTPVPDLRVSACLDPALSSSRNFVVSFRNGVADVAAPNGMIPRPGVPGDPSVGAAPTQITIVLDESLAFDSASLQGPSGFSTIDPISNVVTGSDRTLVYDVGEIPIDLDFSTLALPVSTTATDRSFGATVTVSMTDATGADRRGDASGFEFSYEATFNAGCEDTPILSVTKQTSSDQVAVGERIEWSGSVTTQAGPASDFEFVDRLPANMTYVAGSAEFEVTTADTTTQVSVANGNLTETVNVVGGREVVTFDSPLFAAVDELDYRLSTILESGQAGDELVNQVQATMSNPSLQQCAGVVGSQCATAAVTVSGDGLPTVTKSVEQNALTYGETFDFTVDVVIPDTGVTQTDVVIADRIPDLRFVPERPYTLQSFECVAGCPATDPAPQVRTFQSSNNPSFGDVGAMVFLGDLPSTGAARTYQWRYQLTTNTLAEARVEVGNPGFTTHRELRNFVDVRTGSDGQPNYDDSLPISDLDAERLANRNDFNLRRASDRVFFAVMLPDVRVSKRCEGVGAGAAGLLAPPAGDTGLANFECTVTVSNNANDPFFRSGPRSYRSQGTVYGVSLVDTLPSTLSGNASVPVSVDLVSVDAPVDVVVTPGSATANATTIEVTTERVLAAGDSFEVTYALSVDAVIDGPSGTGRAFNQVEVGEVLDAGGTAVESNRRSSGFMVLTVPRVVVAHRPWPGTTYVDRASAQSLETCLEVGREGVISTHPDQLETACDGSRFFGLAYDESRDEARALTDRSPVIEATNPDPVTWTIDLAGNVIDDVISSEVLHRLPPGYRYVPGSVRLERFDGNAGRQTFPMDDPTVNASAWQCTGTRSLVPGPAVFGSPSDRITVDVEALNHGGDELTWTFVQGGDGWENALWDDAQSYGSLTAAERFVRVAFEVEPDVDFLSACAADPAVGDLFASEVIVDTTTRADPFVARSEATLSVVDPVRLDKNAIAPAVAAGEPTGYVLDVEYWDARWGGSLSNRNWYFDLRELTSTELPDPPDRDGLNDSFYTPSLPDSVSRLFYSATQAAVSGPGSQRLSSFGAADLVVTDTVVHDGGYVPGSAVVEVFDAWGRTVDLAEVAVVETSTTVDGRAATTFEWTITGFAPAVGIRNVTTGDEQVYPSSIRIEVPFTVPADAVDGTEYLNNATVVQRTTTSGGPFFPDVEPVVATYSADDAAQIVVVDRAGVATPTKTASPEIVAAEGDFVWNVDLPLEPNKVWSDLAVVDTLGASVELVEMLPPECRYADGTSCAFPIEAEILAPQSNPDGSTTLRWWLDELAGADQARTLRLPIRVRHVGPEVDGETVSNTVSVMSNVSDDLLSSPPATFDPADFESSAEASAIATIGEPTLSVEKQLVSTSGPYGTGDTTNWEISITNTSDVAAFDIDVSDRTDPTTLVDATSTSTDELIKGWTAASPSLRWFVERIDPGETVTLDVSAVVAAGYLDAGRTVAENTAVVERYRVRGDRLAERVYGPHTTDATARLANQFLTIDKSAADCTSNGQSFDVDPVGWCITVENTGTTAADDVTVIDTLPVGWTYDTGSAVVDDGGGPVATEPTVTNTVWGATRLTWSLGQVAPGATIRIEYATAPSNTGREVTNSAVVRSVLPSGEATTLPGFYDSDTALAARTDSGIALAKEANGERVECDKEVGCEVSWSITAVNPGPGSVVDPVVVDNLPANLTVITASEPTGWAVSVGAAGSGPGGTTPITWTLAGTWEPGSVTFAVVAQTEPSPDEQLYDNVVSLGAPQFASQAFRNAPVETFAPATLTGTVWEDVDGDGIRDPDEPPLSNQTVTIVGPDGTPMTVDTDDNGNYMLVDLPPGDYEVCVDSPSTWTVTTGTDSDVGNDGCTTITLTSGADERVDAGFYEPASITGTVWEDVDGDGIRDPDEPPLSNQTVTIVGPDGSMYSVSTDANGNYTLVDLPPGDYEVCVAAPGESWVATSGADSAVDRDGCSLVTLVSGADAEVDAGFVSPAPKSSGGRLPSTGSNPVVWIIAASMLLALGWALRRKATVRISQS